MYTDIIDLNNSNFVILKDNVTKQPLVISDKAKSEIEEKEISAIADNIIKEYEVEFKKISYNT